MKKLFLDDETYVGIVRSLSVDELRTLLDYGYDFFIYLDSRIPFWVTISGVTININEGDDFYFLSRNEVLNLFSSVPKDYKFKVAIDGRELEVNFLI